jgi:GntR family transcriptional regulator
MTDNMVNSLSLETDSLSDRVRDYLLSLIDRGVYEPGQRLPSQVELAEQLGISRATLREALQDLERRRVIRSKHGVGTFVAPNYGQYIEGGLERLESVLKMASKQDLTPTIRELEVEEDRADQELVEKLSVPYGSRTTVVRRTIAIDGIPVAYMVDEVPASLLASHHIDDSFRGSVLDLLIERLKLSDAWAVSDISAVTATDFLTDRLELVSDKSLLLLEEVLYDGEGTPRSFSRNYFISEHFRFRVFRL